MLVSETQKGNESKHRCLDGSCLKRKMVIQTMRMDDIIQRDSQFIWEYTCCTWRDGREKLHQRDWGEPVRKVKRKTRRVLCQDREESLHVLRVVSSGISGRDDKQNESLEEYIHF